MTKFAGHEITELLQAWRRGDESALEKLTPRGIIAFGAGNSFRSLGIHTARRRPPLLPSSPPCRVVRASHKPSSLPLQSAGIFCPRVEQRRLGEVQISRLRLLAAGYQMTPNEARVLEDRDTIEGGDFLAGPATLLKSDNAVEFPTLRPVRAGELRALHST
jgi:hypothetical protein